MPAKDPIKNLEYVKKSQERKKQEIGIEAFREMHSSVQSKYRDNLRAKGEEQYKKQQAEYMKDYRAKQKALKEAAMKKEKLQAHQERQHQTVVSATKIDVYV